MSTDTTDTAKSGLEFVVKADSFEAKQKAEKILRGVWSEEPLIFHPPESPEIVVAVFLGDNNPEGAKADQLVDLIESELADEAVEAYLVDVFSVSDEEEDDEEECDEDCDEDDEEELDEEEEEDDLDDEDEFDDDEEDEEDEEVEDEEEDEDDDLDDDSDLEDGESEEIEY